MRTRQLETALTVFTRDAAARLQADLDAGAEVPFELTGRSSRGRGPRLYCYQPQTAAFLRERWVPLRRLPSHSTAVALLEGLDGLDRYLLAREAPIGARGRGGRRRRGDALDLRGSRAGESGADGSDLRAGGLRAGGPRGDAALLALSEDVFAEQTSFEAHPERVRAAIERLERAVRSDTDAEVALLATLHGLAISTPELQLARGLSILAPDALPDAPPEALAPAIDERPDQGQRLLVLYTASDPDAVGALARGRVLLGELLRALRLFGDGRIALGPLAWARAGDGGWSARALPFGGRPHGMLLVSADQEDELRAFCSLIARRTPAGGSLAWALSRFELGCIRATETEALSDYLLALRALLGADGASGAGGVGAYPVESPRAGETADPAGGDEIETGLPLGEDQQDLLSMRLAALCALPDQRPLLIRRVRQALALERATIAGTAPTHASADALVRELANHLRALLRDVICGHLEADLIRVADGLIAGAAAQQQADVYDEYDGHEKDEHEEDGSARDGYDADGYEKAGHEEDGYEEDGSARDGHEKEGYDADWHDAQATPTREQDAFVPDNGDSRSARSGKQVLRDPGQTGEIAHIPV